MQLRVFIANSDWTMTDTIHTHAHSQRECSLTWRQSGHCPEYVRYTRAVCGTLMMTVEVGLVQGTMAQIGPTWCHTYARTYRSTELSTPRYSSQEH